MAPIKRVLSGIQPSGTLHLGNYFGMMKPALELQKEPGTECFYFIADYHALTQTPDPERLRHWSYNVALDFLACGLDPKKTVFFRQSEIPEVPQLTWILSCLAPLGLLERCHSYKDKIARGLLPNAGLFNYPILMAADILIYASNAVPVGKDQKQHLEVTRDLAQKFNRQYGETLVIPDGLIREETAVVPGTDGQKMSKSYHNTINIFASQKESRKAIMGIKTDSMPLEAPKDPDKCNVFALYKLLASSEEVEELRNTYCRGGMGYGHAKQALFEKYWDYFAEAREKREELAGNPDIVQDILAEGAKKARAVAGNMMEKVLSANGIGGRVKPA